MNKINNSTSFSHNSIFLLFTEFYAIFKIIIKKENFKISIYKQIFTI